MNNEDDEIEEKVIYEDDTVCPHCNEPITVRLVRQTITPTVKGEYKKRIEVEKATQTDLSRF